MIEKSEDFDTGYTIKQLKNDITNSLGVEKYHELLVLDVLGLIEVSTTSTQSNDKIDTTLNISTAGEIK